MDREGMYHTGVARMREFCAANKLPEPMVVGPDRVPEAQRVSQCAFYRPVLRQVPEATTGVIVIDVRRCASIGVGGRAWSYPGHSVDRTPYGVIQHELGHHVDYQLSTGVGAGWRGGFSRDVKLQSDEPAISGYSPDTNEWFAELFRLYVTNPDLLRYLRPRFYAALAAAGLHPVETRSWAEVLARAPARTLAMAQRRIEEAQQHRNAGRAPARGR